MKHNPYVIDTLGFEIEGTILTIAEVVKLLSKFGPFSEDGENGSDSHIKKVFRDASVESNMSISDSGNKLFLGNSIIRNLSERRGFQTVTTGFEIITQPLTPQQADEFLSFALPKLASAGEIFSPRASIHIHTGFPTMLDALRNAVSLGLKFEGLLYRIAGLGNEYRGSINHSIYAKPLAIPPVIPTSGISFLRLCPEKAQFADTLENFWKHFAITPGYNHRYHPARYFGWNVYSSRLIDTIEFRYFNLCLNPNFVISVARLCQLLAELALIGNQKNILDLKGVDILADNGFSVYESAIMEIVRYGHSVGAVHIPSTREVDNILAIVDKTPPVTFVKENIITHTNYAYRIDKSTEFLEEVDPKTVRQSGHVDIHNFYDGERSIL